MHAPCCLACCIVTSNAAGHAGASWVHTHPHWPAPLPGLDTSHPDLAAKPNIITGSVPDFRNGTTWSWEVDGAGHGTHVAGTIAALSNAFGVAGVAGQGARLVSSLNLGQPAHFMGICQTNLSSAARREASIHAELRRSFPHPTLTPPPTPTHPLPSGHPERLWA